MRMSVLIAVLFAMAACSSPQDMSDTIGVVEPDTSDGYAESAQDALDRRVAAGAKAFSFTEEEGDGETSLREFTYSWPRQVTAIPALANALEQDRQSQLVAQMERWEQAKKNCPEEFAACRRDMISLEWEVVADTPRFLSLSNNISTYTGGAHGNYGRASSVWDRQANQRLEPLQMFTSPGALDAVVAEEVCALLNQERAKRRGGPVESGADDWTSACVSMEDTVLFLGSSTGKAFDRIGIYYGPYVAGPYAEGDFEFTLPVTHEVLNMVRPQYKDAFAILSGASG